ncbi:MAG: methyl-accepting chemotaxis protein [Halocynthiibacter sp.]|jgi:methyl-accepting chemotaxis protein
MIKVIAVVMGVGVLVVGPLTWMSFKTANDVAANAVSTQAKMVTELVARESVGALRFGKGETVVQSLEKVSQAASGSYIGGAVFGADGSVLANFGEQSETLATVAAEAIAQNRAAFSSDGFTVAIPVAQSPESAPIGAVVTYWTDARLRTAASKAQMDALSFAAVLFLIGVAGIVLYVRQDVSKPLKRLAFAVGLVSDGDYDIDIPGVKRKDEIGGIAGSLDSFRIALGKTAEIARESAFRSAALERSSASLLMLDSELNVVAANPSVIALFESHKSEFGKVTDDFSADALLGQSIAYFHPNSEVASAAITSNGDASYSENIAMGDTRFEVKTATVLDAEANVIGFVMEWADVTENFLRIGVLDAIRASQSTAQFSLDGQIITCNENFAALIGSTPDALKNRNKNEVFQFDQDAEQKYGDVWSQLLSTNLPIIGRFRLKREDGNASVVDGGFSVVRDMDGSPLRIVLISNDVTQSLVELEANAAERARMENALANVVEALRIGLEAVSQGDLTAAITREFAPEYAQLRSDFNTAIKRLETAMCSVIENAEMIQGEASEISNAADDLSLRTETQASTLEQTATALDQLTSSVKSASEGAEQASRMVSDAKHEAENSGKVVDEAVTAMGEIETSSGQISKITSVIDDIAFQTNLLALNAGVEAARAGDAGRGFAVVASEVRALAQRSSDAAKEINELISASGAQVKRGVDLVGQAGSALQGIVKSVSEIAQHVDEIAMSSREQSVGLAEINVSVNQLDQVTQQNAAMFEETTAASHALNREVETLNSTTAMFKIGNRQERTKNVVAPSFASARTAKPMVEIAQPKTLTDGSAARAIDVDPQTDDWEDF